MRLIVSSVCLLFFNNIFASEIIFNCKETIIETKGIYNEFLEKNNKNLTETYRYNKLKNTMLIGKTLLSCKNNNNKLTCTREEEDEDFSYAWNLSIDIILMKNKFSKHGFFSNKEHLIKTYGICKTKK